MRGRAPTTLGSRARWRAAARSSYGFSAADVMLGFTLEAAKMLGVSMRACRT
jgi:hypothetical protein